MKQGNQKSAAIMGTMLLIPVMYIALLLATVYHAGMNLFEIVAALETAQFAPSCIQFTAYTLRFVIVAALLYTLAALLLCSAQQNRREGEEHGSARWGRPQVLSRKYRERDFWKNVILTQNVLMGLDGHKHRRNLLQIIVGGSGSGKSQNVVLPNLMQVNASYIVTDPKGELLRTVAPLLLQEGYVIRVFDLVDMAHSDCFNPFAYIRTDTDVLKLVANLIKNTTPKGSHQNDPFWEKAEIALDSAIMFYLLYEAPENECTLEMVMHMLNNAGAKEDDDDYQSPLDLLFEALEEEQPEHIAVKQYKIYKQAAGKTAKSIIISAAVRLAAFNIPSVRRITDVDEMEIGKLGVRKQAIFCVIPDSNDDSLNYLVGMLYTCAFQELYYLADREHGGSLPIPVRFIFDEFANVSLPDGFARLQATMRSRNIMSTIILQNISQLKALFKDDWEGIIGNADVFLYLGGNEQSTHKYISEQLGKETIRTRNSSMSRGIHGSSSVSQQQTGRELMTPDEVRMMDNAYSILLVRGERPVMDRKYDVTKHPNVKYTARGGAMPYTHRPGVTYEAEDLLDFSDLNDLEILED